MNRGIQNAQRHTELKINYSFHNKLIADQTFGTDSDKLLSLYQDIKNGNLKKLIVPNGYKIDSDFDTEKLSDKFVSVINIPVDQKISRKMMKLNER